MSLDDELIVKPLVKKWFGTWPANCDECGTDLSKQKVFCDARTLTGHWGLFCYDCFRSITYNKYGTGYGQLYDSKTLVKLEG